MLIACIGHADQAAPRDMTDLGLASAIVGAPIHKKLLGMTNTYTGYTKLLLMERQVKLCRVQARIPCPSLLCQALSIEQAHNVCDAVHNMQVCARLALVSLAYMWHQPQASLLQGMIASGIEAILIKVASLGLVPGRHLGRTLQEMEPHLHQMCRCPLGQSIHTK